jgi:hypothetical protein
LYGENTLPDTKKNAVEGLTQADRQLVLRQRLEGSDAALRTQGDQSKSASEDKKWHLLEPHAPLLRFKPLRDPPFEPSQGINIEQDQNGRQRHRCSL